MESDHRLPSRRIADELRARIAAGELPGGAGLPAERALARAYGVARNTVREAIRILIGEGLVVAEHGRGTFVAGRPATEDELTKFVMCRLDEQQKTALQLQLHLEQLGQHYDMHYQIHRRAGQTLTTEDVAVYNPIRELRVVAALRLLLHRPGAAATLAGIWAGHPDFPRPAERDALVFPLDGLAVGRRSTA